MKFTSFEQHPYFRYKYRSSYNHFGTVVDGTSLRFSPTVGEDDTGTIVFPKNIQHEDEILFIYVSAKTGTVQEDIKQAPQWFQTLFEEAKTSAKHQTRIRRVVGK